MFLYLFTGLLISILSVVGFLYQKSLKEKESLVKENKIQSSFIEKIEKEKNEIKKIADNNVKENNAKKNSLLQDVNVIPNSLYFSKKKIDSPSFNSLLKSLEDNLENAFDSNIMINIKSRVIKKHYLNNYNRYFLEFKRYIFLTQLMKSAPMYDDKTDLIWHEFLMFTKSYSDFCQKFVGKMIHHEPNINREQNFVEKINERDLFIFLYMSLFESDKNVFNIYPFLKKEHLSKEFIYVLKSQKTNTIIEKYFNPSNTEFEALLTKVIDEAKELFVLVEKKVKSNNSLYSITTSDNMQSNFSNSLHFYIILLSVIMSDTDKTYAYENDMKDYHSFTSNVLEETKKQETQDTTVYTSGEPHNDFGSKSDSKHDSNSDTSSDSNSCSSSSCSSSSDSSCGSSCGSGCGS